VALIKRDDAQFPEQILRYEANGLSRDAAAELLW